ncbi:hypothetical protein RB195_004658 [Necator americanus]
MIALRNTKGDMSVSPSDGKEASGHGCRRDQSRVADDFLHPPSRCIPEVLLSEIRHAGKKTYGTRSRQNKTRTPEEPPPVLINTLARLFTRYMSECKVPKQWKTSKTVLLCKKGDPHNIGKYRPICLLSVIYKLFTRVILNRIENVLDEGQPCEQAGFQKKRIQHD